MKSVVIALVALASLSLSSLAFADETDPTDCPPGSVNKTEGKMSWCEPSVCESDGNCLPNEVCRPIALCVQIGTVAGDAGATANNKASRLIATNMCAADKKCPNTTTCSDKSRCIEKSKADKMGLLTVATAAPSASAAPAGGPAKSSCGCSTVGTSTQSGGAAALTMLALGCVVARRRRQRED